MLISSANKKELNLVLESLRHDRKSQGPKIEQ